MSDGMGNFRGGYSSGSSPAWLLRSQRRAIKQAGKKLQEIDKKYSTKVLKDDIKAESLLSDLGEEKIIIGTTAGCIIKTENNQIILVRDKNGGRGFPKGGMDVHETESQTVYREIFEETGLDKKHIGDIKKLGEYEAYSNNHQGHKHYIWYISKSKVTDVKLLSQDLNIIDIGKFDISELMTILEYDHMKQFFREYKDQIINY